MYQDPYLANSNVEGAIIQYDIPDCDSMIIEFSDDIICIDVIAVTADFSRISETVQVDFLPDSEGATPYENIPYGTYMYFLISHTAVAPAS